jgi:phosphatidylglycerol---prolipoprotein diacylglyceryl transferase
MKPALYGLNLYFSMWAVGAALGITVATRATVRAGFPKWRALAAACCIALAIVLGSKLLFVVEHALFPEDPPFPLEDASHALGENGFRIPGGILLVAPALLLVGRWLRLSPLAFGDAVFPGIGVALVFIRTGCFLNGCCFGAVTDFPIALTFPKGSPPFRWQVGEGILFSMADRSLPVHPLQLYFVLLGGLLYVMGTHWQERKRFDGQVCTDSYLLFFGGTFFLELLRPKPLHLNLVLTAAVVVATAIAALRLRQASPALARMPL